MTGRKKNDEKKDEAAGLCMRTGRVGERRPPTGLRMMDLAGY